MPCRVIGLAAFGVLLSACHSMPARSDVPARIVNPTIDGTAELTAVLERALGPRDIRLAADALTQTSVLTIEGAMAQADAIAGGRRLDTPERFDLVRNDGVCYLVHAATGERYLLDQIECVPVAP